MTITGGARGIDNNLPSWQTACGGNPSVNDVLNNIDTGGVQGDMWIMQTGWTIFINRFRKIGHTNVDIGNFIKTLQGTTFKYYIVTNISGSDVYVEPLNNGTAPNPADGTVDEFYVSKNEKASGIQEIKDNYANIRLSKLTQSIPTGVATAIDWDSEHGTTKFITWSSSTITFLLGGVYNVNARLKLEDLTTEDPCHLFIYKDINNIFYLNSVMTKANFIQGGVDMFFGVGDTMSLFFLHNRPANPMNVFGGTSVQNSHLYIQKLVK